MNTVSARPGSLADPGAREVVVVSVPAEHPYVRRVTDAPGIRVADDPIPAGAAPGEWWPPVALDPDWIAAHRADAEVLHVHFGTESFPAGHLTACIDAAHDAGWRVVFTVHDLAHPQLGDPSAYDAQLDELAAGADALLTLTSGAAHAIRERWGREAVVVPHPALLADGAVVPVVRTTADLRIGVHLKDLRPNVDGPGTVRALIDAVTSLRRAGLPVVGEVRMHHRVRDQRARHDVRDLCARAEHITLAEHERLSDAELLVALSRLDACILPYRHGTHSGWLELCWDLGVPVAAPAVGFYREQHPDDSVATFSRSDADSLGSALETLMTATAFTRAASAERLALIEQRREIRRRVDADTAATHARLYRRLAGRGA